MDFELYIDEMKDLLNKLFIKKNYYNITSYLNKNKNIDYNNDKYEEKRNTLNLEKNSFLFAKSKKDIQFINLNNSETANTENVIFKDIESKNQSKFNVKYGDIVFLTHFKSINFENIAKSKKFKGFLIGNGWCNNNLSCSEFILENYSMKETLFIIEPGTNNYFKSIINKEENKLKNFDDKKNYNEIKKSFYGKTIKYGDNLTLKHLFSECYLNLNIEKNGNEISSIQVILDEDQTENNNLIIHPVNKLKFEGDKVNYTDKISISFEIDSKYKLFCSDKIINKNQDLLNLQIFANINFSEWKLNLYKSYKNSIIENKINYNLSPIKCLKLYNKESDGFLSISYQNLDELFEKDTYLSNNNLIKFNKINNEKRLSPNLTINKNKDIDNFFNLWEVYNENMFDDSPISFNSKIKIKNNLSNLFLSTNKTEELKLKKDDNSKNFIFYFKSNLNYNSNNKSIKTNELIKIKSYEKNQIYIINKNNEKKIILDKKENKNFSLFEIKKCDEIILKNSNIISSIYPFLLKFYLFFQDWGIKINKENIKEFSYDKAIEQKNLLEVQIDNLFETFESIYDFFNFYEDKTIENNKKIDNYFKQNLFLNHNIINILINLLQLITNRIYDSLLSKESSDKNKENDYDKIYNFIELKEKIFDSKKKLKLPQILTKNILDSTINNIINILILLVINNKNTSDYLSNYFNYFINLIDFYPDKINILLYEITLNINSFNDSSILENIINSIEQPNKKNIIKQIFYLKIMKAILKEKLTKQVVKTNQKFILEEFLLRHERLKDYKEKKKKKSIIFEFNECLEKFFIKFNFLTEVKFKIFENNNKEFLNNIGAKKIKELSYEINIENIKLDNEFGLEFNKYIKNYLNLLTYICKDRYKYAQIKCNELGLTYDFCVNFIYKKGITDDLKICVLKYMQVNYWDIKPIIKISKIKNLCFMKTKILNTKLMEIPLFWINEYYDFNIKNINIDKINIFNEYILELILGFFNSYSVQENLNIENNFLLNKLNWILNYIKFLDLSFDWGYISIYTTNKLTLIIYNIFNYYSKFQQEDKYLKELNKNDMFIMIIKLYLSSLNILFKIIKFKINIILIIFLKIFIKNNDEENNKMKNNKELKVIFENLFKIFSFSKVDYSNLKESEIIDIVYGSNKSTNGLDLYNIILDTLLIIHNNKQFLIYNWERSQDMEIIINFKKKILNIKKLEKNFIKIIIKLSNQKIKFLKYLINVEIIEFEDNKFIKTISLFNKLSLKIHLNKSKNIAKYKTNWVDIIKILTKKLKLCINQKKNLNHIQNIYFNSNIYKNIISILNKLNFDTEYNLIQLLLRLIYYMTLYNIKSKILKNEIELYINLVHKNYKLSNIINNFFKNNSSYKNNKIVIKFIINKIHEISDSKSFKFNFNLISDFDPFDKKLKKSYLVINDLIKILIYSVFDNFNNRNLFIQNYISKKFKNNKILLELFYIKYIKNNFCDLTVFNKNFYQIKIICNLLNLFIEVNYNNKKENNQIKRIISYKYIFNIIEDLNISILPYFWKLITYFYFDDFKKEYDIILILNLIYKYIKKYYKNFYGLLSCSLNYQQLIEYKIKLEDVFIKLSRKNNKNYSMELEDIKKKSNFWKILLNKKNVTKYSILDFLLYFVKNFKNKFTNNIKEKLSLINIILIDLINDLIEIENIYDKLNFNDYFIILSEINNRLKIIINKKVSIFEEKKFDLDYFNEIVKDKFFYSNLKFNEIFNFLYFNKSINKYKYFNELFNIDSWNKSEFNEHLNKVFFKNNSTINSISNKQIKIIFSKIENKYCKVSIKKNKVDTKLLKRNFLINDFLNQNQNTNHLSNKLFFRFVNKFEELLIKEQYKEDYIQEFVKKIVIKMNKIGSSNLSFLITIQNIFKETKYEIFLFNIFKNFIYLNDKNSSDNNQNKLIFYQNLLNNLDITNFCIDIIANTDNKEKKYYALNLLNLLLKNGNKNIQINCFKNLKNSQYYYKFFGFFIKKIFNIKNYLWEDCKNYINDSLKYKKINKIVKIKNKLDKINIIIDILNFIQNICFNYDNMIQNFFRIQNIDSNNNINLIQELTIFTNELLNILHLNKPIIYDFIFKTIQCLINFSLGPSVDNQNILIRSNYVFKLLNICLNQDISIPYKEPISNEKKYKLFILGVKFLKSLILDNENIDNLKIIINDLNIDLLKNKLKLIYFNIIKKNEKLFLLENFCSLYHNNISKKSQHNTENCNNFYCDYNYILLQDWKFIDCSFDIFIIFNIIKRNINYNFFSDEEKEVKGYFIKFFGNVEILKNEKLVIVDFIIPYICNFITRNIKYDLVWEINRNSDTERLKEFLNNAKGYQIELIQKQIFSKYNILNYLINKWILMKSFVFILVIIINLILLFSLTYNLASDSPLTEEYFKTNIAFTLFQSTNNYFIYQIVSIIQLIISFIVFILCFIERYSTVIFKNYNKKLNLIKLKNEKQNKLFLYLKKLKSEYLLIKIISTMYDYENIFNLIYLGVSIFVFTNPIFYTILLFYIIKASEELQTVIKTVTLNIDKLWKTLFLGLLIIYFYSVVGFILFRNNFGIDINENYQNDCSTLLNCYLTIWNNGLRAGGGIGEAINQLRFNNSLVYIRFFYDFSFFLIIIIMIYNLIFGTIIDTFADIRNQKFEKLDNILNSCFICGTTKKKVNTKGKDWNFHINKKHNMYNYLYFLIYINNKDLKDCSGTENYVKELILNNDIKFIPTENY